MTDIVAIDTETWPFRAGLMAPPVVCLTTCTGDGDPNIHVQPDLQQRFTELLRSGCTLVGANIAYDMRCLATDQATLDLIFQAYADNRVVCVLERQKLLDLARGHYRGRFSSDGSWIPYSYSLSSVAARYGHRKDSEDPWRSRYAELDGVPLENWPLEASRYAMGDAEVTMSVYRAQEIEAERIRLRMPIWDGANPLASQYDQARAQFSLGLISCYGIRTDSAEVSKLEDRIRAEHAQISERLADAGLLRPKLNVDATALLSYIEKKGLSAEFPDGVVNRRTLAKCSDPVLRLLAKTKKDLAKSPDLWQLHAAGITSGYTRNIQAASDRMVVVCRGDAPLTSPKRGKDGIERGGGRVALDAQHCKETEDPVLKDYAELSALSKTMSTDLEFLREGSRVPIHTRFETIAKTGRTTSSNPNIQNLRREVGIRECFVPRPGTVFVDCDYSQLELYTHAQVCMWWLGYSVLGEVLNAGNDPHLAVGAQILGISYAEAKTRKKDEDVKEARQLAKVANFGFPGGLGIPKLILFAKKSKISLSEERAKELKRAWIAAFPEMSEYLRYVDRFRDGDSYWLEIPGTGILRGGGTYCSTCNAPFQGLGAAVAKRAGWYLASECYSDVDSPLFGSRVVNMIHDQYIVEIPETNDHKMQLACARVGELMNLAGKELLPDVPVRADPILARLWSKDAARVENSDGTIGVWERHS